MKNLISIIIPFFNSENTIEKCIDSILNQTQKNFEIILVDNCSTDLSKKLIDKYLKKYKFIKYYNIKKQNTSLARNKGLKEANGNLICFVDSDDQIHKDYLKELCSNLNDADINICSFTTKKTKLGSYTKKIPVIDCKNIYNFILSNKNIQGYVWNKIFKIDIIRNNNILFNENLKIGEDIDFLSEYLKYCNKISYTNRKLYYYNRCSSNTVNNINNFKYTLDSWKNIFNKFSCLNCDKNLQLINYYYLKKYYEIKYYEPDFKLEEKLQYPHKLNLFLSFKLFLYKYFTNIIVLTKKVRDRI